MISSEIKNLACESCWETVFSVESFRTMWAVVWDKHLQGKDIEFRTRRWAELLESANNCQLCRLLCMDIPEEWKETLSMDDTFFVKLGFRKHTLHGLVLQIEAHMGSRTYFVCATEGAYIFH